MGFEMPPKGYHNAILVKYKVGHSCKILLNKKRKKKTLNDLMKVRNTIFPLFLFFFNTATKITRQVTTDSFCAIRLF